MLPHLLVNVCELLAVVVPVQLIPAQPLWLRVATITPSIATVAAPLVPPPDRPAPAVTPVMSPTLQV